MTKVPEELVDVVADAMIEHGPDGHCDGAREIAQAAVDWLNATEATAAKRFKLLSDNDGHHYLVPAEKEDEFNTWVDSFNEDEEGDPDGYEELGAVSLGCSPTCVSFTDPLIS